MRPKKVVLVVDTSPHELGMTMMVLSIRGFAVVGATTRGEVAEFLKTGFPDAILFADQDCCRLCCDVVPEFISYMTRKVTSQMPMAEVVTRLKIMCQGRRGPLKASMKAARERYLKVSARL